MEERLDLNIFSLENKVKKEFKKFYDWWEFLSLKQISKKGRVKIRARKTELEVFNGYVIEQIERASKRQLEEILKSDRRVIKRIYSVLDIQPYPFCKKLTK